jgi:hypothetical protein
MYEVLARIGCDRILEGTTINRATEGYRGLDERESLISKRETTRQGASRLISKGETTRRSTVLCTRRTLLAQGKGQIRRPQQYQR